MSYIAWEGHLGNILEATPPKTLTDGQLALSEITEKAPVVQRGTLASVMV